MLDNLRVVNYYFCAVCHYCFEAESLPDRCPDCGKTVYQNRPAIRLAAEKEVQDLRNRQISRRMDTHGIIVVERFATFHYY